MGGYGAFTQSERLFPPSAHVLYAADEGPNELWPPDVDHHATLPRRLCLEETISPFSEMGNACTTLRGVGQVHFT
jgi:hypothetical protein